MSVRDHDLQLIAEWEDRADHAAEVEREIERLAELPLDELVAELTDAEKAKLDQRTREHIIDYYATDMAERRIQRR